MARILVIESSGRKQGSFSRMLVSEFIEQLKAKNSAHQFTLRDLAHDPLPVLNESTTDAIRTPPDAITTEQREATAVSEQLIGELKAADFVVIGSPMYNWSISASLKTWLDQVMRIGMTFGYAETGLKGLLNDKPALVVLSRGGSYDAPERAAVDMQKPYLQNVLGVMGLAPTFATMEGSLMGEEVCAANLAAARKIIADVAATLD
jgi:FMN-dependent NADH-azoreductase